MVTRKIIHLIAILFMLTACNGMSVSERLNRIDSLIVKEQYDSAYVVLNSLGKTSMTEEEQAHYYLLSSQLGFITNQPLPSDSLLDLAITYYNKVENHQKLADANYYKSFRSRMNEDYPQAILYGKEAERLAANSQDMRLQFKIAENLACLNGLCDNDIFQLKYAKKALAMAQKADNKNWIAYSYNKICFAFSNLGQYDSALYYVEKSVPYLEYMYDEDKAQYLTNIGLLYKAKCPKKAMEYFEKALAREELPETIEYLADIYYAQGNKEKAYNLWKKALIKGGGIDKDNLIHTIIAYNLEQGNIDDVSKNVDEIINIKDSILNKVKNDTIKDLQLRFDHEVAMHEADRKLLSTQRLLMGLVIVLVLLTFYIYHRRKKEEERQREYKDQFYAYTTEISQLEANREEVLAQICELQNHQHKDQEKIGELEEEVKNAEITIRHLNKDIDKLLTDAAHKLKMGKNIYDKVMEGKAKVTRGSIEEELFVKYFASINYPSYNRLKKVKRTYKLTTHAMFYLILIDLGKSDDDIREIMSLSPEGLRSIRSRTKPMDPK